MRTVGTKVRGIRAPIIKEGDNLVDIVVKTIMNSCKEEGYKLYNNDVIGITESVVARAQGNYVLLDDIAQEIKDKFSKNVGIVFPILSRNRFSMILKGIAKSNYQIYLQLSYPRDEVGNALMDINEMEEAGIDPHCDIINGEEYLKQFGGYKHPFTGINYVKYYKELVEKDQIKIILSNNPETILKYTDSIIAADIHTLNRTKDILKKAGAGNLIGLDELCVEDKGRGYNPKYGLLGSNKASENKLKLFPRNGKVFVNEVQKKLKKLTKKNIEVMIYGDGAFKDPVGKIWELADPVVSPAFTFGLKGTPNEVKLKYLADNDFKDLEGKELLNAMKKEIKNKDSDLVGKGKAQGTTPRQITDLLGSLCDLVSGSGDKGTPIILIQGYFDNLSTD